MTPENAEICALQAFAWLISQEELIPVFLGSTGASRDDLRERVTEPGFQVSVLDFILMDDAWVVSACDALGWPYEQIQTVRMALPGGGDVHWT